MAIIFDGKKFAKEKEDSLRMRVLGLKARGIYPKLASLIIGNDPASELYVNLKKKAAERISAEVDIYKLGENTRIIDILTLIKTLNIDKNVNGIMVQLPLPGKLTDKKDQIIGAISPEKDVDGLRSDSKFLHPTSKAVIDILRQALKEAPLKGKKVCVVGATGMVGTPLVKELKNEGYELIEARPEADILISCTGRAGLISENMVKDGAIVIDVGSPKGDVQFESVSKKAAFITPVPGGVGPVTITSLLENLISAC